MQSNYAQAAQSIKKELKQRFPGISFSVRSKGFSMGNDVNVNWTNGPTVKEVEKITSKYQQGYFDGSIDLYEYNRERQDTNGSAKYVFANRHIDDEGYKAMVKDLCTLNNIEFTPTYYHLLLDGEYITTIVHKIIQDFSVPVGYKIIGLERTNCTCGRIEEFYKIVFDTTGEKTAEISREYKSKNRCFAEYKNPVLDAILSD